MASKYDPLKLHLEHLLVSTWRASFAEIEAVLGFSLPDSARRYSAWWENETDGQHIHAHAWLDAGWRTEQLDRTGERVTFKRL